MGLFLLAGAVGTFPAPITAPQAAFVPTYVLTLTGYNAVPGQTDDTPFITASGAYTNPEVVAARSQDLRDELPFGTIIAIDGPTDVKASGTCGYKVVGSAVGYRVIADTMNARYTKYVDVVFKTLRAATTLGVCPGTTVRVVGFVDIKNPANLPKSQADLAAIVAEGSPLAVK